jgi:hypothetical protein
VIGCAARIDRFLFGPSRLFGAPVTRWAFVGVVEQVGRVRAGPRSSTLAFSRPSCQTTTYLPAKLREQSGNLKFLPDAALQRSPGIVPAYVVFISARRIKSLVAIGSRERFLPTATSVVTVRRSDRRGFAERLD